MKNVADVYRLTPVQREVLSDARASRVVQDQCGPFTDVTPGFCPYVLELYYLGITAGTSATTFSPDDPLTRGQGAVFIAKGLNQALVRSSRRAALGQWWTTTPSWGSAVTTVGVTPLFIVCDGQDVWTANFTDSSVSRVRAGDGKLLETWTGAEGAFGVLAAMGRVFVTGTTQEKSLAGRLYVLDPSQPAVNLAVVAGMPPWPPPIWTGVSAFSFSVTDSGLLSGVRIVTLSAVCVIVNSNGFT